MNFEFYKLDTVDTEKFWLASSSCHHFYLLPFFLFLLLTDPDSDNFENKWKFVETSFWTLLIVIIWVYSVFQYCCIFSFLVDSVGKFIALTWACRVNLADLSWGSWVFRGSGEKKGFSNCCFEFFHSVLRVLCPNPSSA